MKQTAVEWLLENLITEPYSEAHFEHNSECWDKAEKMEKQQIFDFANEYGIYLLQGGTMTAGTYNETFKSEEQ